MPSLRRCLVRCRGGKKSSWSRRKLRRCSRAMRPCGRGRHRLRRRLSLLGRRLCWLRPRSRACQRRPRNLLRQTLTCSPRRSPHPSPCTRAAEDPSSSICRSVRRPSRRRSHKQCQRVGQVAVHPSCTRQLCRPRRRRLQNPPLSQQHPYYHASVLFPRLDWRPLVLQHLSGSPERDSEVMHCCALVMRIHAFLNGSGLNLVHAPLNSYLSHQPLDS